MTTKITEDVIQNIIKLFNEGYPVGQIASHYEFQYQRVYRLLVRRGELTPTKGGVGKVIRFKEIGSKK